MGAGATGTGAGSAARVRAVRARTEALAAPLSPEDAVVQSMEEASPAKWHLAHTTWFLETFLLGEGAPGRLAGRGRAPFDPSYARLFNSYYESLEDPDAPRQARHRRGLLTRPSLAQVLAYRHAVDRALLEDLGDLDPALLELGLQHEQQHQELLLADALHLLAQNPLRPAYGPLPAAEGEAGPGPAPDRRGPGGMGDPAWLGHPGGLVEVGEGPLGFAFDCERPRHAVALRPYRLRSRCVTAGEYLAFMGAGGYREPAWWMSEGWALVRREGWEAPFTWARDGGGWQVFGPEGPAPLDPGAVLAHVSWFEADAYARWAGARLPTEAEWEALAREAWPGPPAQAWTGEVWQWTASPFVAYPGFRPGPGALGEYNGKFMSGQMVLRGGSRFTAPGHARPGGRNFFPPASRWQRTGIRLAEDL